MDGRAEIRTVIAVRAADDGLGVNEGREEQGSEESEYGRMKSHCPMVALAANGQARDPKR